MQDTATHAAAKRLLEDIGYEGTSARPIERWFFFRDWATKPSGEDTYACVSGVVGVRAFTRRARGREARERRATRPHALCARGDPAGHAGALQIGAFARHASPRHVAPPSIHHPSLGRTRMWEWQHDTLGTDALGRFFDAIGFFFFLVTRSGRDELKKRAQLARVRENSPRLLPPVRKPHPRGERRAVTTATTLEKGIRALESASPAAPFDVTLLEEKQAEPLFLAAAPAAGGGGGASKDLPAGVAGSAQLALGARFAKLASECAIVLMHEEEDVGNKAYMIEAIRVGVVDVVRFPLVAQSMRTLWQHAVRRMIRVAARETRRSERPASARASGGGRRVVGGTERRSDRASADSGDSTASEEGRLKRGASSPESVLPEAPKSGAGGVGGTGAATGGKRKAGATGSSGSGSDGGDKESAAAKGKEDGGKKSVSGAKAGNAAAAASGPAGKPKPQPRSTQQWRAAEQRGRRLAIKPHTAVVGGVAGVGPGSLNPGVMPGGGAMRGGGGVYYHPGAVGGQPGMAPGAHAGVLGQTQTMTINGQQVQVWVPMNASGGGVAYGAPGQGGHRGGAGGALGSSPPRGEEGEGSTGGAGHFYAAPNAGAPQMFHGHPGAGGGMLLVQQANGQQVWVPAQHGMHHGMHSGNASHGVNNGTQMWKEDTARVSDADVGGSRGDGATRRMEAGAVSQISQMSQMRVPLGLGLKRSDSLQQMVESSGLLDGDEPNARVDRRGEIPKASRAFDGSKLEGGAMDADMFRDAEMLEEDALDAILAHARDGNLLSFDGMDEAMLEAAAGPEQGVRRA